MFKLKVYLLKYKKLVKFLIVGMSGAVIDFGILILLVEFGHWPVLAANTVSFTVALLSNFFLNKFWTWRDGDTAYGRQFVKFSLTSIGGLLINNGLMWLGLFLHYHYLPVKVIASLVVAVWNFLINNHWTFKNKAQL